MSTLVLTPKGAGGAKALGALPKAPAHWYIIQTKEEVTWSNKPGPWFLVYPDIPEGRQHLRWVNRDGDRDFSVEVIL